VGLFTAKKKQKEFTLINVGNIDTRKKTILVNHLELTKGLFETSFSEDKRFVVVGKALDDKKNKYDYSLYHLNG